uniref:Uncharacterized protein n=1 Tax=Solanum tuberosum TaxID=4113 RepID=M1DKP6_SOLTU
MKGMSQDETLPNISASPQVRDEAQTSLQAEVHYVQILGAQHVVAAPHLVVPPVPIVVPSMIVKCLLLASKMMDKSGKEVESGRNWVSDVASASEGSLKRTVKDDQQVA